MYSTGHRLGLKSQGQYLSPSSLSKRREAKDTTSVISLSLRALSVSFLKRTVNCTFLLSPVEIL